MIWFESKYKFDFFLFGIFQWEDLSMRGPNLNLKNWNSNFISVKIVSCSKCHVVLSYMNIWDDKIIDRGVLPEENHPRIRVIHISHLGIQFDITSTKRFLLGRSLDFDVNRG